MSSYRLFLVITFIALLLTSCGGDTDAVNENIYDEETGLVVEVQTTEPETTETTVVQTPQAYTSMFDSNLDQFRLPKSGDTVVKLVTNYGDIYLLTFPEVAPKAVENFITHGQDNYYDGIIFHRVMDNFMIQGGDPGGTGTGGESIWGKSFEDEFSNDYFPYRGALAMANAGPTTNGSQFFIVQSREYIVDWKNAMLEYGMKEEMAAAYEALGGTPHLFNKHTVFGQVVAGMDVVDAIAAVEVGVGDKPVKDVVIEDVVVITIE